METDIIAKVGEMLSPVLDYLANTIAENAGTLVVIWLLIGAVKRVFPDLHGHQWYAKVQPALPFVLGIVAVFIPGWLDDPEIATVGAKVKHGITLGGIAMGGHQGWKVFKGKDARLEASRTEPAPADPPPAEGS